MPAEAILPEHVLHILRYLLSNRLGDSFVESDLFQRSLSAGQLTQEIVEQYCIGRKIDMFGVFLSDVKQGLEHTLLRPVQCLEPSGAKQAGSLIVDVRLILRLHVFQDKPIQKAIAHDIGQESLL